MALPTVSTSTLTCDTGSELGITLYRQPPLPPPYPPGTYPTEQIRKWWISKTQIDSCSLEGAIREMRTLFASENSFTLMYYDGLHLMPVVTDKDLRCALNFFLANASIARVCSFYLTEIIRQENVPAGTSVISRSRIVTSKKYATSTKEVRTLISSGNEETSAPATSAPRDGEQADETTDRLARFKARVLEKHGDKADVECATAIRCLYPACTRKVMCKKYNQQNFNTHVLLCHSDDQGVKSQDIRSMFLTMIAQDQRDKNENEQQEQIDITDGTALIDNSF